jgi:hypothetical protein
MTLSELMANMPPPADLANLALVFSSELKDRLIEVQTEYGDPLRTACPAELSDGRWMHQASILTACLPGGIYAAGFSRLDAGRFGEINVIGYAEALALLPPLP